MFFRMFVDFAGPLWSPRATALELQEVAASEVSDEDDNDARMEALVVQPRKGDRKLSLLIVNDRIFYALQ